LFKARIRPTNLYATTEEENDQFAFDATNYGDVSPSIIWVN